MDLKKVFWFAEFYYNIFISLCPLNAGLLICNSLEKSKQDLIAKKNNKLNKMKETKTERDTRRNRK